ncbi:hypothetical protein [Labilibaculum manganireducens]|uniref:hypothetical protein n=1 Tax=Labilibaculum manganireducens TaxID=1940525 RepID=UPI0029F49F2B|nr:hypothetical protein [Labilibaculum manganireducens]
MSLSSLSKDIITLIKQSGEIFENIKANVQPKIIFIHDEKLPLEENDKIYRKLPSGLVETYIVIDRGYYSGIGGIKGHYQAKVRKEGSINEDKYKSIVVYHASGANSRININSTDNSNNYSNDSDLLFKELKVVLEGIIEGDIKEKSLQLLEELKSSKKTPSYLANYQEFIGLLASHMTVIAPFIPALTQLI